MLLGDVALPVVADAVTAVDVVDDGDGGGCGGSCGCGDGCGGGGLSLVLLQLL